MISNKPLPGNSKNLVRFDLNLLLFGNLIDLICHVCWDWLISWMCL